MQKAADNPPAVNLSSSSKVTLGLLAAQTVCSLINISGLHKTVYTKINLFSNNMTSKVSPLHQILFKGIKDKGVEYKPKASVFNFNLEKSLFTSLLCVGMFFRNLNKTCKDLWLQFEHFYSCKSLK